MKDSNPRIVIVGGGFGGLAVARALRETPARIVLIDRTNHNVFQPLLYQVATAVLAPSQIGAPIRGILGRQRNTTVIQGTVTGLDVVQRSVVVNSLDRISVPVGYDYLVIATGARHSYFGHPEFETFAPGLKSLVDAVAIRNRILQAFEQAEAEADPERHANLLTFVLVGAGPTGVEMAGAIAVVVHSNLRFEYRRIDPTKVRVVLVDMASTVLGSFATKLSEAAKRRLESLGVEVRLGHAVEAIDADGVVVAGERIASKTVIWTAGVEASPAGKWLNTATDRAGRVRVDANLTVPGHPEIFAIGDTASCQQDGRPLPGVAQVAIQQGRYVGRLLRLRLAGKADPRPFRYFDKGNLAVVGKGFAVLQRGTIMASGFAAWLVWVLVHLQFLSQSYLRVSVLLQWVWTYLTGGRGSRLILTTYPPVTPTTASRSSSVTRAAPNDQPATLQERIHTP
jgi:NADH dehydrogenase